MPQSTGPGALPEPHVAPYRCRARFPQFITVGDDTVLHVLLQDQAAAIALDLSPM